jgi:hypothetical protein
MKCNHTFQVTIELEQQHQNLGLVLQPKKTFHSK